VNSLWLRCMLKCIKLLIHRDGMFLLRDYHQQRPW
jgi:hypothetical protein